MERFHVISCQVLWREICHFAAESRNMFTFDFLEQGLHRSPDCLRDSLQKAIDAAEEVDCSAVLIGYGLCCNGIERIVARGKKLVIMRGHDCITFLLGSKERYRQYFDENPGTYWYSPGWIDTSMMPSLERYGELLKEYTEKYGEDNAKYLLDIEEGWMDKYSNAVYVDLGFDHAERYREFTKKAAKGLGWKFEELEGDVGLMKDFLGGNWDAERFLVVEPGETIFATNSEAIIEARTQ